METIILKTVLVFFCGQLLFISSLFPNNTQNDSLNAKTKLVSIDSVSAEKQIIEKPGFFCRNEGQITGSFLGALFAGLIALSSIRLTHKKNKEIENERLRKEKLHNENVYCNRLMGIHSDLTGHEHFTDILSKKLSGINRTTNEYKNLWINRVNPNLPLEFIDQCRLKLMEYDDYNVEILSKINNYFNSLNAIIADLDFSSILLLKEKFENEDEYLENISEYFKVLLSNIECLKVDRDKLQEIIIKDLEHFPRHIKIINRDALQNQN